MKLLEIPIFDITLEEDDLGLTCISFVERPAICRDFVAFSEEKEKKRQIWLSSNEQRRVISPVLIPNQLIFRLDDEGNPFYIRWNEETIRLAAQNFLLNGFYNNVSIEHSWFENQQTDYEDSFVDDVNLLRMWIVEEGDEDLAKYGFDDIPVGSLMVEYRVFNDKLWEMIKQGTVKGLSIEAFVSLEKIKQNIQENKMKFDFKKNDISLLQRFIAFLNDVSAEAEGIASEAKKDETESGEVNLVYWLDDVHFIQVDAEGFARDEEMHLVNEGSYKLSDGNVLSVGKDGKFQGTTTVSETDTVEPVEAPVVTQSEEINDKIEANEESETVVQSAEGEDNGETVEPVTDTDENSVETSDESADEEGGEENKPVTMMKIGENDVEIDQSVADYILSLQSKIDEMQNKLDNTPSIEPVGTVIKQNSVENEDNYRLSTMIERLNSLKR